MPIGRGNNLEPESDAVTFQFDTDGYLTDGPDMPAIGIGKAYGSLLGRARQINREAHELLFSAEIHNRDPQEILTSALFVRSLEQYQATMILLGTGLVAPAKVTLRATLESVFTIRAVAAHNDALIAFINADLIQRRKMVRRAQQYDDHVNLRDLREALSSDFVADLDKKIISSGAKSLKTEDLSKLAGMHEWYTTIYALLSQATHTNVRELDSYLSTDKNENIIELQYAPSLAQIPKLTVTAIHCIILAAEAMAVVFELDFHKLRGHLGFVKATSDSLDEDVSLN